MKKVKALVSLILSIALIFSTVEMLKISAYTVNENGTNTKYSDRYLMNGSFEDNISNYKFSANYAQPIKNTVPYWDTTAYNTTGANGKFEFFKNKSAHFNSTYNENYKVVAKGEVAAELNADEESTIYQRINTIVGSTYTWGLSHRGRDTKDSMVLIIGPEQYDESNNPVDPSKPSKTGQDQFVRITNWLKTQYGVDYPEIGCSHKYTVYSRPFAANGNFKGNISDDNQNISLVETDDINQEWSVWVISSSFCNTYTDPEDTNLKYSVNGWSNYGTNVYNDFDDIIKGAGSKLKYDCTYTVPKDQTKTLFAFCSYSSGRSKNGEIVKDSTYGNLLDNINFDLYQPVSSSITPGGIAGAETIKVTSDILTGKSMHSIILDGKDCTIYTKKHEDSLKDCTFTGAYVTVNNANGTSVTTFRKIKTKQEIANLSDEEIKNLSLKYFIEQDYPDPEKPNETWNYYTKISINSPVSVHLIYTKAPFVLYDSNGGKEYYFSPDNNSGGNLVGFASYFKAEQDSDYYTNSLVDKDGNTTQTGFYKSHAALPNDKWDKNPDGSSPHRFCGWSVLDNNQNQIILNGEHTVTYNPETGGGGMVSITDSVGGYVNNLQLDASHGITLTALWKFANKAQAQTRNVETGLFENSAVGGYVQETLIADELRGELVENHCAEVNGVQRIVSVDALGDVGDKIMFKAIPDSANNYAFTGWYCKNKETGNYELKSTSTSLAVTIEEGIFNTYYARFEKATYPVVFKYTPSGLGDEDAYDYYQKSADNKKGQYYQNVAHLNTAVKPNDETLPVKTWYTSPTERGTEYIFDFSTPITEQTVLYAGPSFTYNYFNYFKLKEPWYINTYGTLKFDGNYIDLKNDADVTDYNVYMLKGTLGEDAPLPSAIINNPSTKKVGKSVNSDNLIFNTLTSTGQTFNRAGATYSNFYLFNMKTPVWVVFDFTYKGIKYTSTVKDRSLYNCITTYMDDNNKLYTNYPPKEQDDLRKAQKELLESIQNMYDQISKFEISEPSGYADASSVSGLTYDSTTENPYTFESATAIRNIEPWGLKYSLKVTDNTVTDNTETENTETENTETENTETENTETENTETENTETENTDTGNIVTTFSDYGAVVLTDKSGLLNENTITIQDMLDNENSVMYSKSNSNVYSLNGAVEIYYVNNMLASDFDKNTFVVFFVKDSKENYYYSDIIKNSYNEIANADTSEYKDVSTSIVNYSEKLKTYCKLIDDLNSGNQ